LHLAIGRERKDCNILCRLKEMNILISFLFVFGIAAAENQESCSPDQETCANELVEEVSLLQSNVQVHISNKLQDSSSSSQPGPYERVIHVTVDSMEELPTQIEEALAADGSTLDEWEIIGYVGGDNNTMPLVADITLRHRPLPEDDTEYPEGSLISEGSTEDEDEDEDDDESEEKSSFIEESNFREKSSIESEDENIEEPLAEEQANQSFIELEHEVHYGSFAKRKKNKKQKKWVAKQMAKLAKEVCVRPDSYSPHWDLVVDGSWVPYAGPNCRSYQYESPSLVPGMVVCTNNCEDGEYKWHSSCVWKCDREGDVLAHMNHRCHAYCASNQSTCIAKHVHIALSFIDVLSNFYPPAKAVTAIKAAVKVGTKIAIKKALIAAAKAVGRKLLKKAKKNLKKHMKSKKKEIQNALKRDMKEVELDMILEGGLEELAQARIAEGGGNLDGKVKSEARELVEAVDPTGVSDLINAISADNCEDMVIGAMPTEGLESELCGDESMTSTNNYADYRGCQTSTRSGYTCQAWDEQSPHTHTNTPENKPEFGMGEHNYCRSSGGDGIWCYTTSSSKRWEHCDPIACPNSESYSGRKKNYRGCQDTTRNGYTCQAWTEQTPHTHSMSHYIGTLGLGDHSYCRDPTNGNTGIWCYTTSSSKRWDYCDPL